MAKWNISFRGAWLKAVLLSLFCYALFGKTFAYLFVGELVLLAGLLIFLFKPRLMLVVSDRVLLIWGVFAIWGLLRTVPFLGEYQFAAVRDAVLWGYGLFALLIVAFLNRSEQISRALNAYRTFLRWYLPIIPVFLALAVFFKAGLPNLPWAPDINILSLKAPDTGVHLAAAGLFLLLFPDDRSNLSRGGLSLFRLTAFLGWALCAIEIAVVSRGGFVAMMVPIILVSFLKPKVIGWKVVGLGVLTVLLSAVVLESNLITAKVHSRTLDADTVTKNLGSLVGNSSNTGDQDDNKAWRLNWWGRIVNYTVRGPYFWNGKGFGVNLATSDGPPGIPTGEVKLRSPHNGTMTVLARTGVPGLVIWVGLNFVFGYSMFRAYRRATKAGSRFWGRLNLWIFCYWISLIINSSFDVYLEGPQGGIWYWSIVGFGVAALRIQNFEARQAKAIAKLQASNSVDTEHELVHV